LKSSIGKMMSVKLLTLLFAVFFFSAVNAKRLKCKTVEPSPPCGILCARNYFLNYKECRCECRITEKDCPAGSHFDKFNCQCVECTQDEEFSCGNPYCEASCENYEEPCDVKLKRCEDKCYCKPGYMRNATGECVTTDQCPPKKCGLHQTFTDCGSTCPDTCDNYKDTERICSDLCVKGCFCDEGYVRNDEGECVTVAECPKKECDGVLALCIQGYIWDSNACECVKDTSNPTTKCPPVDCEPGFTFEQPLCKCVSKCDYMEPCSEGRTWDLNKCECVNEPKPPKPHHNSLENHSGSNDKSSEKSMEKSKEKGKGKTKERSKEKSKGAKGR